MLAVSFLNGQSYLRHDVTLKHKLHLMRRAN